MGLDALILARLDSVIERVIERVIVNAPADSITTHDDTHAGLGHHGATPGAVKAGDNPDEDNLLPSRGHPLHRLEALGTRFALPVKHSTERSMTFGTGAGGAGLQIYARSNPEAFREFLGPHPWHVRDGVVVEGRAVGHGDEYRVSV